jgi:hypothetical protein
MQRAYKEGFNRLRAVKKEIEHLLKLIEQNRDQLQVSRLHQSLGVKSSSTTFVYKYLLPMVQ